MDLVEENVKEAELGKQMSFLEHLDELRRRLVRCILVVTVAFLLCWNYSGYIYNFLAVPVYRALAEAQQRQIPTVGLTGNEKILPISNIKIGDKGRYVFDRDTRLEGGRVVAGTSVNAIFGEDSEGKAGLFTDEPIFTANAIIPKGMRIPVDITSPIKDDFGGAKMIVTTATEPFTLYVTVSLYSAIAISMPFLLLQIWGFISPALYRHERSYVTPFILLSTISFILGAAFGYYILFPPAVQYMLWLGRDFDLMLRATDYFDLITIIMLAMGIIFQMPAVTYVLSRIGLVTAGMLVKSWKIAIVVILIVAAVVSPTGDIPNLLLFASPMVVLYLISIFIAWLFGKARQTEANMVI